MIRLGQKTEGTIARLNPGFGFISIANQDDDFFFHKDDLINNQHFNDLRPKMIVEFIPIEDTRKEGKIRASEVTVLQGKGPLFGIIKNLNNGFGFVSVAGGDIDYFFHRRDLPSRVTFDNLYVGMEMSFVAIEGKEGKPAASEIEIMEAAPRHGGFGAPSHGGFGAPSHGGFGAGQGRGARRGSGRGVYHGKPGGFSYGEIGQSMAPPCGGPYGRAHGGFRQSREFNPYAAASHAPPPPHSYGPPAHAYGPPAHAYGPPAHAYAPPGAHAYADPTAFPPPPAAAQAHAPSAHAHGPPGAHAYAPPGAHEYAPPAANPYAPAAPTGFGGQPKRY